MNISVKSEYALQAIFDLAMQPPGESIKIADIARRQKIPQKFLELILSSLKKGGFVESRRGAEGGYRLARAADQIAVGEVLAFVEQEDPRASPRTLSRTYGSAWIFQSPPFSITPALPSWRGDGKNRRCDMFPIGKFEREWYFPIIRSVSGAPRWCVSTTLSMARMQPSSPKSKDVIPLTR